MTQIFYQLINSMENHGSHTEVIASVVISAIVIIMVQLFALPMMIEKQMVAREIEQVGGKENYDKIYEYQLTQASDFAAQLDGTGNLADGSGDTAADTPTAGPTNPTSIEVGDIAGIIEDYPLKGNADARFVWVEYSDLECPYCKSLHDAGTISQVMDKYGDDVAFVFKHYPLDFHQNAARAAEAAECAAQLGGSDAYYAFIDEVFAQGVPVDAVLKEAATSAGLDADALMACADEGKYADKIQASMSEGQSLFGVTGTPGNVVIDTQTGEYRVIAGAYPASEFIKNIDEMLENN